MSDITLIAAFLAGVVSFLSPCVLPLLPGFLAYVSQVADPKKHRFKIFMHAVMYVLGFSIVFSALGILLNTVLKSIAFDAQTWLARIGGVIMILFGLYMVGLRPKFLLKQYEIKLPEKLTSMSTYLAAFLFGAAFAVAWSPCSSAALAVILGLALSTPGIAFSLLFAYTLGLGIPFLIVGALSSEITGLLKKWGRFLEWFTIIMGVIVIVLGVLVLTGQFVQLSNLEGLVAGIL